MTCVVVACGASAAQADLSLTRGAKVIVVNEAHRLWPWADILYACDMEWWLLRGPPDFKGRRVTCNAKAAQTLGLERVALASDTGVEMIFDRPGIIGAGGNSGFQAINLAISEGARRIVLVGFDYGGEHWHGRHQAGLNNPAADLLATWAANLDNQAPRLAEHGVEIINTSPTSALKAFPKLSLEEAICAYES